MLIPFFYRIYGDKRSAVARQVAAFKERPTRTRALHLCEVRDSRRSREQTAYNWVCLVVRRKRS